jgi:hypothetical protein
MNVHSNNTVISFFLQIHLAALNADPIPAPHERIRRACLLVNGDKAHYPIQQ